MAQNGIGKYSMVAIGGSAGSLDVILNLIAALPDDSGAAFVVIVHRKPEPESLLVDLIASRTSMKVKEVEDKEAILKDTIYVAPPDYHLLLESKVLFSLDSSEKIHFSRPSIDVTFEYVAQVFGEAAIGVLLSGANEDGAVGLKKIKEADGYTVVQDPSSADVPFMPEQAIKGDADTSIVMADHLPGFIRKLLV